MSKLFYDNYLDFEEVKKGVDLVVGSIEEKEELWNIVDEIIHHRVLVCVLDNLNVEFHSEFIEYYHQRPYDTQVILYLQKNIGDDFDKIIKDELEAIKKEMLTELGKEG